MRVTEGAAGVVSTVLFAVNVEKDCRAVRHCDVMEKNMINQCVFLLQSLSAPQTDARGASLCPQRHG